MSKTEWTGADVVCAYLKKAGVTDVFGLPGEGTAHLNTALSESPDLRFTLMANENAIPPALSLYHRASKGEMAAAMVTQGVGLSHMLTHLRGINLDATPAVIVMGQVPPELRQPGTAHYDDPAMLLHDKSPFVKAVFSPQNMGDLIKMMPEVIACVKEGRPGPVILELGTDVQAQTIAPFDVALPTIHKSNAPDDTGIERCVQELKKAKKPVIIFGELLRGNPEARALAHKLLDITGATAITGFRNFDVIDHDHPAYGGSCGIINPAHVTQALKEADAVVFVGHNPSVEATEGYNADLFKDKFTGVIYPDHHAELYPHGKIAASLSGGIKPDLHLTEDIAPALHALVDKLQAQHYGEEQWQADRRTWRDSQHNQAIAFSQSLVRDHMFPKSIQQFMGYLREKHPDYFIINDSGDSHHQFNRELHAADTHGAGYRRAMGNASGSVGAALGMHRAGRNGPIISTMGDGSFAMNMGQMLQVMNLYLLHNLPIHTLVLDDGGYGNVKHRHERVGLPVGQEMWQFPKADYAAGVRAMFGDGIETAKLDIAEDVVPILDKFIQNKKPSFTVAADTIAR